MFGALSPAACLSDTKYQRFIRGKIHSEVRVTFSRTFVVRLVKTAKFTEEHDAWLLRILLSLKLLSVKELASLHGAWWVSSRLTVECRSQMLRRKSQSATLTDWHQSLTFAVALGCCRTQREPPGKMAQTCKVELAQRDNRADSPLPSTIGGKVAMLWWSWGDFVRFWFCAAVCFSHTRGPKQRNWSWNVVICGVSPVCDTWW